MSIASEISRISQNVADSLDAVASKGVTVPSGSTSDDLAALILQIQTGAGSAITITDEEDSHGGIIRHINAVSLAGITVSAAHLESGYTAVDALGNTITGTMQPGGGTSITVSPLSVTSNGTYTAPSGTAYSSVTVSVSGNAPNLQAKTNIDPTESTQTIQPDNGYDGLSSVQINAISSSYVGTGITRRSSTDLTASGATVTVPAGYYSSQATKSVTTMTLPTSASSSATSGYTSKATIGRSTSNQYINIPPGYNSAGGYYTISAVPNGTVTAPSSISGSTATVSTGTNTLTLTKTVSVTPNVTTTGYISSGTAGNASVSLTANVTTKAAATITPTKSAQTIASGTYLTGTQTIAAIPAAYQDVTQVDAAAGDVVSGKKIVNSSGTVVTGTLVIQTIYSGSSAPSSSTGVNGDIYIQTA